MVELDLIHILSNRESYNKYKKFVKEHAITDETATIIKDMGVYFGTYPETDIDWERFSTWFKLVRHPGMKEEAVGIYAIVFKKLETYSDTPVLEDIIQHYITLDYTGAIVDVANRIIDGEQGINLEAVRELLMEYDKELGKPITTATTSVTDDLETLLSACVATGGLEWRLEELNVGIGPLRFGDMIIIGARPETGKTTFLTSELTYFAKQIKDDRPIIIFNNEERGNKIMLRAYQSALGLTLPDLQSAPTKSMADYAKAVGDKDRIRVFDVHGFTTSEVEQIIKDSNPCIVVFNVFDPDKLHIGSNLSQAEANKKLAAWGRQVGMSYNCTVFGVVQADGSAEGQQWINMSQLYGSKTGLQGEADAIITIGVDNTSHTLRHIHVPKNKLPGGPRSDPAQKHGFFTVEFDGERGRYISGPMHRSKT